MSILNSGHRDVRALPVGYVLSDYKFEGVLGSGSFGITYLALDSMLNKRVAIKEFFPREFAAREGTLTVRAIGNKEDHDNYSWGLKRFIEEARILAMFDHPNIVHVRRYFEANGTAYLVMDYCDGIPLDKLVEEQGPLDANELKRLIYPILDALEHVHNAHLLHRDIKPANIYVKKDGSPVLLDFGAARQEVVSHSKSVTSIVTPGYGALEQYSTHGEQGPSTDIYGFAATLYKVITGEKPQDAASRMLDDKVIPSQIKVSGKFDSKILYAIDRAMSIKPNNRPQTIDEWRNLFEFKNNEDATILVRGASTSNVVDNNKNKSIDKNLIIIGLLGIILIGGGWQFLSNRKDSPTQAVPAVVKDNSQVKSDAVVSADRKIESPKQPEKKVDIKPAEKSDAPIISKNGKKSCSSNLDKSKWSNCYGQINFPKFNLKGYATYKGDFENGQMHGEGEIIYEDGRKYNGSLVAGEKHGQGTLTYKDGSFYKGSFESDQISGQGVEVKLNGEKYVGNFKFNRWHGEGTYTDVFGDKYVGEFRAGAMTGKGVYYYRTGRKLFEGTFQNGKLHGFGSSYDSNGVLVYTGRWVNGVATPDVQNSSGTDGVLAQCKQYAAGAKQKLELPKKFANGVLLTDITCEPGTSKPRFIYKYSWDTILDIDQEWINLKMRENTKKAACVDMKSYISAVDVEFAWYYGTSSAVKYPGKYIGTLKFTQGDCQ